MFDKGKSIRDKAKPLTDAIIEKLLYHMRYKMGVWPKEDDICDLSRITKSILVQHFLRSDNG